MQIIDVSMIGMDAGGAPGELAWKLYCFAVRVLRGAKRAVAVLNTLPRHSPSGWTSSWRGNGKPYGTLSHPMKAHGPRTDEAVADHVTVLMTLCDALYSNAAQALDHAPMAQATLATHTSR